MTNYPAGDYLIRLKNAALAGRHEVVVKNSKFAHALAQGLIKMRIVREVEVKDGELTTYLAFHKKAPVLLDLKLVSKPGLRQYADVDRLKSRKRRNASELILSTPVGIMGSREALKKHIGGEIIAEVW